MSLKQYEASTAIMAMEILHQTTGLNATVLPQPSAGHGRHVRIATVDGRFIELPYQVKPTIDRRDQLSTFKSHHDGALLLTNSLSRTMADYCRELNIQFVDQAGNCFLQQPGLFVFVSGAKNNTGAKLAEVRGLTPAALRVMFAVLTLPAILNDTVRRIAEVAGISHGAAGTALITLEESGFFVSTRAGRRTLATPERWLDAWTEGYLGRIRPKLEKHTMSAPGGLSAAIDHVIPQMRQLALGGEAAAAARNMGLKPGALTLYLDLRDAHVMRQLVQELKLRRDPNGQVELLNFFWNTQELDSFPTVPDALIYADLVGTGDTRTMEIATEMRKEICAYVASEA